jgi:hypothetical protein
MVLRRSSAFYEGLSLVLNGANVHFIFIAARLSIPPHLSGSGVGMWSVQAGYFPLSSRFPTPSESETNIQRGRVLQFIVVFKA